MRISMFCRISFGLFLLFCLSACSSLERNPKTPSQFKRTSKVVEQRGGDRSGEKLSQRTQLKKMENSISNKKEIEQYSKALPWFQNDEERLDFLAEPGFEARQRWLQDHSFFSRAGSLKAEMQDLVEAQDIALGMPQNLVRQSWGDPDSIEVSGNPQFKNERWRYNRFVSSQDGYKSEKKIVYFEGGKVVAWELE